MTDEQARALGIARELAELGTPLFLCQPDPGHWSGTGYALPRGWQNAPADPDIVDHWRPGMALCAVTGHVLDVIDTDPRSGGVLPDECTPPVMAIAATPSGGYHYFVSPIGVASRDGAWPGIDVKSGEPSGSGRGFAFIAPTIRKSKVDGISRPYIWDQYTQPGTTTQRLRDKGGWNQALDYIRQHIADLRSSSRPTEGQRRVPRSVARDEWQRATDRLVTDLRHWSDTGWGGEAHAGLLAASTHLARLSPEHAAEAYEAAFAAAGLEPDPDDMAKLESALASAVPDIVVPDADMSPQELFWAGATAPAVDPPGGDVAGPTVAVGPEYQRSGGFAFLDEFELSRIPVPDPVVDGLLFQATVGRVFGPSNVGKTFIGLDLAAHVANGMAWQGHEVKQGVSIYVAAEGAPSVGPRLSAWRSFHNRPTGVLTWPEPVPIGGATWAEFIAACVSSHAGLVVLDTQGAMTVGRKENDNDDAKEMHSHLTALAMATGACVLLVHHNGWAEDDRARGASAAFNGLDTELQLTEGRRDREVQLFHRKQRYIERGKPTRLRLQPHDGQLVVTPHGHGPESDADAFLTDKVGTEARAVYEQLVAYEASGGDMPAKMTVRALRPLLTETLGIRKRSEVLNAAIQMFNRSKGVAIPETQDDE